MKKPVVQEIFSLFKQYGVQYIVCSPGSRNAALLQQADEIESIKKIIVIDERTASFVALGIAMVSKRPVVLVCTSGSALLNYGPAVAEAYYQGLPLLIVSADRPSEWIDQDDSQTIRQYGSVSNIVKESYNLDGDRSGADYLWYVNRVVNEGIQISMRPKGGPVHFNVLLDGNVPERDDNDKVESRVVRILRPDPVISKDTIRELAELAVKRKILIVAGFMLPDNRMQKAFLNIARLPNVCVMAETLSNLHLQELDYIVDPVLFRLDENEEKQLAPDIVISVGGALVSRKLKEFIRRNPPKFHWSLNNSDNLIDCFKSLTEKIEGAPSLFIQRIAKRIEKLQTDISVNEIPEYKKTWKKLRLSKSEKIARYPWSDLKAMDIVLNNLPLNTNLFLSNGTAVRYGQIIPYPKTHATYCNRGVSGIEGCTSTALGASLVYKDFTCIITGDMSFGYDIGALGCRIDGPFFRIIVLDNGGGDIFRFIKATKNLEIRETYLCADREIPIEKLSEAYNWEYQYANSEASLRSMIKSFFKKSSRPKILHIDTTNCEDNAGLLNKFLTKK